MSDERVSRRTTRREMLRVIGLGAVVSVVAACSTTPTQQQPAAPAATSAPAAAQPTAAGAAAAPKPNNTPVLEAKSSTAPAGGEVVKITAWTIGPDAPSFYRRDNLIAAAETVNKELEAEGSKQRVQVDATFES